MSINTLIWYIIIGLIAGWLANRIMSKRSYGLIGNMIIGVLGAIFGGWIFGLFNISAPGILGSLVVAVVGAIVLIYSIGLIKRI